MASPWERMRAGEKSALPSGYKGPQPGGISSIPSSSRVQSYKQLQPYGPAATREKFFPADRFIPTDRLIRRGTQERLVDEFKQQYTKPVTGATGIVQMVPGAPTSLAQYTQDVAKQYGPTLREIGGDILYGLGSIAKGFAEKGTPLIQLGKAGIEGLKNLFTESKPLQNIYYGTKDVMKGYDPFTKKGVGVIPKIETQPLPSLDLEAKMSAYEDPIKFYASSSKQKYPGYSDQQSQYYYGDKPKESPTGDQYLYADASQSDIDRINKMRQLKSMDPQSIYDMRDVFQLSPDITLDEIQRIKEGTLTEPTGQYAKATLRDPYALLRGQNTQNMIFNKGGRVRGTGIMGAL